MRPGHGASSLPGGWLPCGFPSEQDDVAGATTIHVASCSVAVQTNGGDVRPSDDWPGSYNQGLQPSDIDNAYGFPANAAGMTVAVVDAFDDPQAESDLNTYRAQFNLPACTTANGCFRKLNQAGNPGPYPHPNIAWSYEISLDIEMVSAVCPRCPILLIEANSAKIDDLGAGVDKAVALGARSVSNSYYAVEWPGESSEDAHYNHPGVAITVSSGDDASSNGSGDDARSTKRDAPYYPASSPYVTAIGGTSIEGESGYWTQTPWQYAGKGCSRYEGRPAFQVHVCPTRSSVDMAVVADPQTGVAVYSAQVGGWIVAGGTSVGSPVIAAAYALSGNPAGPSFSYAHRGAFVAIGDARFDQATGLGSPNGVSGL